MDYDPADLWTANDIADDENADDGQRAIARLVRSIVWHIESEESYAAEQREY